MCAQVPGRERGYVRILGVLEVRTIVVHDDHSESITLLRKKPKAGEGDRIFEFMVGD